MHFLTLGTEGGTLNLWRTTSPWALGDFGDDYLRKVGAGGLQHLMLGEQTSLIL